MQKSETISKLAAALVRAQPMVEGAKKDSVNPHFRSKYADLGSVWDAVSGALEANGLAISQYPDETSQGQPALTTMLIHESGEWIAATYPLISVKQDPQGFASAQTYARRYGLAAVMGVISEDDDGQAASRPPKPPEPKPAPAPVPQQPSQEPAPEAKSRAQIAKEWAEKQIPKIATMTKTELDAFTLKFRAQIADLPNLDKAAGMALDKAVADRLEELFA